MGEKVRLDRLLVERGLCESRTRAQALVVAGKVRVAGKREDKAGTLVALDAVVDVEGPEHPFVSRGGVKLAGALDAFAHVEIAGKVAMDVGASTGGFTDCLLQRGASRVHAVDVGYGQLSWKLAADPRVVVHDRTNIRALDPAAIGEKIELVVADCSFIASAKVIPHLPKFLATPADAVVLVKPQFELDPSRVGKGGIVRDAADHEAAVEAASVAARDAGFVVAGRAPSLLPGRDGNREFFLWLQWPAGSERS
jgi:23S rRNA (cytidine1920-2'-O)/16S rRNA (cytidine1409-2'-O)-methyltransferase